MKKSNEVSLRVRTAVLDVIKNHIGKTCPTNTEIGEMAGVNRDHVCKALTDLCRRNILRRGGRKNTRFFTILETGECTGKAKQRRSEKYDCNLYPELFIKAEVLPEWVRYDDISAEELDDRARAYLAFDASRGWPASWPRPPIAIKTDHIPARLRSISSHAS